MWDILYNTFCWPLPFPPPPVSFTFLLAFSFLSLNFSPFCPWLSFPDPISVLSSSPSSSSSSHPPLPPPLLVLPPLLSHFNLLSPLSTFSTFPLSHQSSLLSLLFLSSSLQFHFLPPLSTSLLFCLPSHMCSILLFSYGESHILYGPQHNPHSSFYLQIKDFQGALPGFLDTSRGDGPNLFCVSASFISVAHRLSSFLSCQCFCNGDS